MQRSMLSAFSALFGYGGWAWLVNSMHGSAAAIKAACVQGGYSFLLTFIMTMLIEAMYRLVGRVIDAEWLVRTVTIVITCVLIFSASWWVNAMAGTPEIFSTVILGYVVGGIYTSSYVIGLARHRAISG